jgi:probable addiction module antidote protein
MPKRTTDYDTWLTAELADPEMAANYVNAALSDAPDVLPVALRNVAKAHRIASVAEQAGVTRESLYVTLSEAGNPTLSNLNSVLRALGLRLAVVPASSESAVERRTSINARVGKKAQKRNRARIPDDKGLAPLHTAKHVRDPDSARARR